MRIGIDAHFVGIRHGGNEHHFENVIRTLAQLSPPGHEFFLFNYLGKGRAALPGGAFRVVELRKRSVFIQRGLEIPLLDRKLGLDVLHVPFNVLPVGRSRKIVTIHDLAFLHVSETFDLLERKRMEWLTGLSARKADHIFTVSEYSKWDIMRQYGIPEKKISVTPNAVDRAVFHPWDEARKAAFREKLGLSRPFLLFVGTLQPRKNVLGMLKAFASLKDRPAADVQLILVGRKGWIYDEIFRFLSERGLKERVRHLEGVDQETLAGLYNAAVGLVFPSFFEGFGMPILEAMSCGCPVASANVTSMPEIYGDAALAFAPTDLEGMSRRMHDLISDAALRASLREKGFRNSARYSWEETAGIVRKGYLS